MARRPPLPGRDTRGRRRRAGSLCAFLLADSSEIEDSISGGFDDWHAEYGDDDRAPDPAPDEEG